MNRQLKRAAEQALLLTGVPALTRRINRTRAVVLMYHNVLPQGAPPAGDRSLHVGQRAFAAQLDDSTRDQIKETLFREWLQQQRSRARVEMPIMEVV